MTVAEVLALLHWRREVHALYQQVRERYADNPGAAHEHWRGRRDQLFAGHAQSPLDGAARRAFPGLGYYPYDPRLAFSASLVPVAEERYELPTSTGSTTAFVRVGRVELEVGSLDAYWLDAYGGGLFVPFRDATGGTATYAGGRYLLDTVKGADLGTTRSGELVLDFNFAYNPSCHYDSAWACPLAPPDNWLASRIEAGEKAYPAT